MTIIIENENSIVISARAEILVTERDVASSWASQHVNNNPSLKWILGNYVQADTPNRNKQMWAYNDLMMSKATVDHAPLNMLHRQKHVVGAFTAAEMIYPQEEEMGAPYIEALAAMWHLYFPEEFSIVDMAHNQGALFFSMECVSESITCSGDGSCGQEFAYAGTKSPSYCDHLNMNTSSKLLNKPHFLAGALIFPPVAPGWKDANIKEISSLLAKYEAQIPGIYDSLKAEADHLSENQLEDAVIDHLVVADDVEMKKSAKKIGEEVGKKYSKKWMKP